MAIGIIKWFNGAKGFGKLAEDQKVSFNAVHDPRQGKSSAENLRAAWPIRQNARERMAWKPRHLF
ncbi:hypothetical protein [Nitrospirillum sp. BR 11163]|uniref:cold-shock protein n=1 Tax=Nitrospirillum sp. BR 11163 TaxID=3104323 RepID=UPI002AFF20A2|nr:hypothetical protein [Nitrospirillum sp. BR 11163]MEA1671918.1 hypothetical protein [Nitrospirillum sp. BR 11163]